jgi:hypothetical protein
VVDPSVGVSLRSLLIAGITTVSQGLAIGCPIARFPDRFGRLVRAAINVNDATRATIYAGGSLARTIPRGGHWADRTSSIARSM